MAKRNMEERVKVVHALDPASYGAAAEAFSAAIDCKGFDELLILIPCGAFTATGDVVFQAEETVQDPAAADGNPLASGWGDITGAVITEKVVADDQKTYMISIDLRKRKRFVRLGYDVDDDACIFGIIGLLGGPHDAPVTQATTAVRV